MSVVNSNYKKDAVISTYDLDECEECGSTSVEKFQEEVENGYVWDTYCHSCGARNSGYEF
ncbi:hypothetical protein BSA171_14220 [Bacillus safensis]|uniref:hypothetical protein n=1 Tax=Bacillus safensis TaxID=561879 RepID=UPI00094BE44C|nr:hypothetical protein [Bacillus safensis]APT49041.1 hypothetical protein BSA41_03495 [Bacillus safensis]APT54683.1 hypothetical protein BSA171_14220 [Bacillus safensis]